MISPWLAWRYVMSGRGLLSLSSLLAVIGVLLGVGSLMVAMAVVTGYEETLKRTVIDVTSHLVVSRTTGQDSRDDFHEVLKTIDGAEAFTPFVFLEAVLAHQGQLSGVALEGVEEATVHQVVPVASRLVEGEFRFGYHPGEGSWALVGKQMAKRHHLKIGDVFRLVLPTASEFDRSRVKPRIAKFRLAGTLDLGRHDYDERYILTDLRSAQDFAQIGDHVTGYRFRFKTAEAALPWSRRLSDQFYPRFEARSWFDMNRNLFQAVQLEKPVIFFVLLIMVVAAAFNITSTLFVSVIRRYRDISVLRAMGATKMQIMFLFASQGLVLGIFGTGFGLILGWLACLTFNFAQKKLGLMPAEVYKLDQVVAQIQWLDVVAVASVSLFICLLATLRPARRGASLSPVEGLRYE